jgi:hypothetical protein
VIVVDDRLLFEVLSGTETAEFAQHASDGIATTFSWYYRLSRALSTGRIDGSLTRQFASLTDERRTYVHRLLEDLPTTVEMLHPRELVPPMSAIAALTSVNFLTAEAIGLSMILEAPILVSTRSAVMDRAAAMAGVECLVLPRA